MTAVAELNPRTGRFESRPSAKELLERSKAKQKSPEEIAADERSRHSKREAIKTKIAAAVMSEEEWNRLNQAIEVDAPQRLDAITSKHVADAAPLQERLTAVEEQIIAGIKSRATSNPALESERSELLDKLRTMNAELKEAVDREEKLIDQMKQQRAEVGSKAIRCSLEQELLTTLANPDLRIAYDVATNSVSWATARLEKAKERHARLPSKLNTHELHFAASEVERTKSIEAAAKQAVLDE